MCLARRLPPSGAQARVPCATVWGRCKRHPTARDLALVVCAFSWVSFFLFLPSSLAMSHLAAGLQGWQPWPGSAVPSASEW